MFNAIKYTEELKRAGFSPDQADVSVKVLIDIMNESFATKSDIRELESKMEFHVQRMLTLGIGLTATIVKLIH